MQVVLIIEFHEIFKNTRRIINEATTKNQQMKHFILLASLACLVLFNPDHLTETSCTPVFDVNLRFYVTDERVITIEDMPDFFKLETINDCEIDFENISFNMVLVPTKADPVEYKIRKNSIEKLKFTEKSNFPIKVFIENIQWKDSEAKIESNAILFKITK